MVIIMVIEIRTLNKFTPMHRDGMEVMEHNKISIIRADWYGIVWNGS